MKFKHPAAETCSHDRQFQRIHDFINLRSESMRKLFKDKHSIIADHFGGYRHRLRYRRKCLQETWYRSRKGLLQYVIEQLS